MPLYEFDFTPRTNSPPGAQELTPTFVPLSQLPDKTGKRHLPFNKINIMPDDVHNIMPVGFETFDAAIKKWLEDMRIPTKDGLKNLSVRVARGDKSVLVWKQALANGRATLPVMSVHRNSVTFHAEKFSPPYHYMRRHFADRSGTRLNLVYRPRHFLAEYQLTAWTEHRKDAEHISYQLMTRFSPLAEIHVADEYLQGNLIMKFGGHTDNSDIESPDEKFANVRYDYTLTAEVWLPLPEKLTPSILGKVRVLQDEDTGEVYNATLGRSTITI